MVTTPTFGASLTQETRSIVLLASAAQTTTQTVQFGVGPNIRSIEVVLTSQTQAGAGLTLSLQAYDPAADAWETIATAAKLSAAGTKFLQIDVAAIAVANVSVARIPRDKLRAVVTVDDATSYTWSLAAHGA